VRVFDLLFAKLFCFIETKINAQLTRRYVALVLRTGEDGLLTRNVAASTG
jgi:hypothetical protein